MCHCTGLVRAPGGWNSQFLRRSGTWRWQDRNLYTSAATTPRTDPLPLISLSGRIDPRAAVRPGGLSHRKLSMTPLFLLPFLSDIPPQYCCFCCLCSQIYPHNITVSAACALRYTPTILLFLLPVLSDIPPPYYCFCHLRSQIHPPPTTVSAACPFRYTPTILLFLLPVLSDIPPQYYCFCCLSYQIYHPQHTGVVCIEFIQYGILLSYEPTLITYEHLH
jgi:hypothetical protein